MNKKLKLLLVFVLTFIVFSMKPVFAASANITASKTQAYVGESVTVTVSYYATAWNLNVSGAVNDIIAGFDLNGNVNGSQSYTLTASSPTTYTVRLSGDVSDYNETTVYPSGSVTVQFIARPQQPSTPVTPSQPSQPSTPSNPQTADNRSGNANLKSLKVDGYDLVKVNDTTYTLKVKNSIDKITIKADKEDSKATIKGDGSHELKVGDNKIDVVVTAENGTAKTYTITVTRKDNKYTVDQLKEAIEDSEGDEVDLILDKNTTLSKDDLKTIKDSKKTVQITKYDDDKKVLYTWIIDGSKINTGKDIDLNLLFEPVSLDKLRTTMEYAEGFYFSTDSTKLDGSSIKVYVGNMYSDGTKLNLYQFLGDSKKNVSTSLEVKDGYVTVSLKDGGDYFLTQKNFESVDKKTFNIFIPICIVEFLIILVLLFNRKGKKNKEKKVDVAPAPVTVATPTTVPQVVEELAPMTNPSTAPDFPINPM